MPGTNAQRGRNAQPGRTPAGRPSADRLAVVAMVAGIVAFLCGVLPVLGLIVGTGGVILGLLARRRSNRPALGTTALVLSILAVLTNLVVDVIVIVSIVTQANNLPG